MHKIAQVASVAVAMTVLSVDAMACGESLFRVGKGLTYREYTAPLPGNILIVARTEGELAMADRLLAAGHRIEVVSDPAEVAHAMAEKDFDIVMSLFSQRGVVEAALSDTATSYIPVARHNSIEESQAAQAYERSLSTEDSVKSFLKTIHRTLKQKEV